MAVIKVDNISKHFGALKAVDDLSFEVQAGLVFGFLGQNGSGKSTTIRMLLSLIHPSSGNIELFGKSILKNRAVILEQVGAIIERPDLYPYLSATEHLQLFAKVRKQKVAASNITKTLEQVGLAHRAHDKVQSFSLGMKQRLGIAAALLPNPKLLILDEPTNGLDPSGIQEVRGIIRDLADTGTTVFVSSHILSELEMICEYLVMLREGKVIFSGRTQELLSGQKPMIIAKPEYEVDLNRLAAKLNEAGFKFAIVDECLHINASNEASAAINRMAFEVGITLASISVVLPTLEETFFEMTGDNK